MKSDFTIEVVGSVEMPPEVEFCSDAEMKVGDPVRFSFQGVGNRLDGDWEVVKVFDKMVTAVRRTKGNDEK